MPDTLEEAPAAAGEPAAGKRAESATFRLAAFGAVLILALFAGYGIGRLNEGARTTPSPTAPAAEAADGHGHGAQGTAPHDDTGTAPHVHNADGWVTPGGGMT